jgi:hypothetical protein
MTSRPGTFPDFATSATGPTQIATPDPTHISTGFVAEFPPFQWFNYLFKLIGLWLHYVDEQITAILNSIGIVDTALGDTIDRVSALEAIPIADVTDIHSLTWGKTVDTGSATISISTAKAHKIKKTVFLQLYIEYTSVSGNPTVITLTPPSGWVPNNDVIFTNIFYGTQNVAVPLAWAAATSAGKINVSFAKYDSLSGSNAFSGTLMYTVA